MFTDDGFSAELTAKPQIVAANHVMFEMHPLLNEAKTLAEGREIYDDVEYIQIISPGDPTNIIHRPVEPQDRKLYATQYRAWRDGNDQEAASGTLLDRLPGITAARIAEARHFHVRTVEQLAEMADSNVQRLGPGWLVLRQKARDYIASAKGSAPLDQARATIEQQKSQMAALEAQVKELSAKVDRNSNNNRR